MKLYYLFYMYSKKKETNRIVPCNPDYQIYSANVQILLARLRKLFSVDKKRNRKHWPVDMSNKMSCLLCFQLTRKIPGKRI